MGDISSPNYSFLLDRTLPHIYHDAYRNTQGSFVQRYVLTPAKNIGDVTLNNAS